MHRYLRLIFLRRAATATAASLLVAWALLVTVERAAVSSEHLAEDPGWFDEEAARYAALRRDALSVDHVYHFVLLPEALQRADEGQTRGFVEYLLAPAVLDMGSDSPWLVVDAGDEASLAAWLAERDVDVIERPGNGLLVARERER